MATPPDYRGRNAVQNNRGWRIDHILVSHALEVTSTHVVDYALSDHLPICVELVAPEGVRLAA